MYLPGWGKGVKDCVQGVNHILVAMLWVKDYSILLSEETVSCDVPPNASLSVLNHTVYVFKEKYLNSCIIFCCYVKSTFNCYNHTGLLYGRTHLGRTNVLGIR